ncbi:MAG: polyprenyl synthetase family protein [Verrucomicrobiota bacterium]
MSVTPQEWKTEFDRRFETASAGLVARCRELECRLAAPALEAFLANGGKRLRPVLFLGAWAAFDGSDDPQQVPDWIWTTAAGLEFFQAFLLIHDDLVDNALTRRGQPALHRRLGESGESASPPSSRDPKRGRDGQYGPGRWRARGWPHGHDPEGWGERVGAGGVCGDGPLPTLSRIRSGGGVGLVPG